MRKYPGGAARAMKEALAAVKAAQAAMEVDIEDEDGFLMASLGAEFSEYPLEPHLPEEDQIDTQTVLQSLAGGALELPNKVAALAPGMAAEVAMLLDLPPSDPMRSDVKRILHQRMSQECYLPDNGAYQWDFQIEENLLAQQWRAVLRVTRVG